MGLIRIHEADIQSKIKDKKLLYKWIQGVAEDRGFSINYINYIVCSDEYLLKINIEFLNHHTLTDIITFPYNSPNQPVESEIYISYERVKENAIAYNQNFKDEFHRVLIHGLLHLTGQNDKTKEQEKQMRALEDYYLNLRPERLKL